MQILNMKFTLNPFSYTNTAKHEKMDTISMLKIHFYVLCAKHMCVCVCVCACVCVCVCVYMYERTSQLQHICHLWICLYTYTEFTFSKTRAFTLLVAYVCKIWGFMLGKSNTDFWVITLSTFTGV